VDDDSQAASAQLGIAMTSGTATDILSTRLLVLTVLFLFCDPSGDNDHEELEPNDAKP